MGGGVIRPHRPEQQRPARHILRLDVPPTRSGDATRNYAIPADIPSLGRGRRRGLGVWPEKSVSRRLRSGTRSALYRGCRTKQFRGNRHRPERRNFGWNLFEEMRRLPPGHRPVAPSLRPFRLRTIRRVTVIGGYVYRARAKACRVTTFSPMRQRPRFHAAQ